ncbi:MAG: DUF1804 family protein [Mariprofundus sp.]|nr:DUF1804 family protein [Mariprofundus sp.]
MSAPQAKELYLKGHSVSQIATMLGLSRTTIYGYKSKSKAHGIDWDDLRFLKATDSDDAQKQEEQFVALLIFQFERAIDALDDLDAEKKIALISKHIETYYKLKKQQGNPKVNKAEVAKIVLHKISEIALQQEATAVIHFLSDHADQIVSAVLK